MEQRQRCDDCKKKLFRIMINDLKKRTEVICNNCGKIKMIYTQNEK